MRKAAVFAIIIACIFFASGRSLSETGTAARASQPLRLTLEECIELGLENNPQLNVSEAQVEQARAQVVQARANKLPTLSLTANWVRSNKLPDFKTGDVTLFDSGPNQPLLGPPGPLHVHQIPFPGFEISNTREGDIYNVKVEAQYALYTGGRVEKGIETARLNVEAAREDLRLSRNELIYNIEQAFYGVLLAQQMVELTNEIYSTMEAHLGQVRQLYNEGLVSNLDLIQVEAQLASIRPSQVRARNGLDMARLGLNNYLNVDMETKVQAVGELEYNEKPTPVAPDLYTTALANRPEMEVMRYRIEMADKLVQIQKAGARPTVGLFANYAWDRGQELPPNDTIWRDGYQAGAALTVPLFDGLATKGNVEEAEAQLMQARAGKRALTLGIQTQVEQAVLAVKAAREQIEAERANVDANERNLEVARARYSVGLATNLDVTDAQTQLLQARTQLLSAIHDYNVAWAQLDAAQGMPEWRSETR